MPNLEDMFTLRFRVSAAYEVTSIQITGNTLVATGRVDRGKEGTQKWTDFVTKALRSVEGRGWEVDISQKYVIHKGHLKYTWRVILNGQIQDMYTHLLGKDMAELTLVPDVVRGVAENGKGIVPALTSHRIRGANHA